MSEHGATDAEFSGFAVEPNRSRPITCVYNDGPLGIYRTADVEALVAFYEAMVAHEDALLSFELHGAQVDRLRAAAAAITPELLARCSREESTR